MIASRCAAGWTTRRWIFCCATKRAGRNTPSRSTCCARATTRWPSAAWPKNHALRTAGIRLIRFKGALSSWPLPEVLRERVLAAARPTPSSGFGASGYASSGFSRGGDASGFAPSGFTPSGFEGSQPPRAAGVPSGVMSLTDLAGLAPANQEDPWQTVRKRS
ncbi:hypothetical protein ACFSTJ_13175 [Ottowia pentelensis]|uniref:hypothetical protein n=1 Tax=Ottowia pentelensis TaxID=511108 RepID=UPI00362B5957